MPMCTCELPAQLLGRGNPSKVTYSMTVFISPALRMCPSRWLYILGDLTWLL